VVGGLERFRDHFKEHAHQYALIGGSACDLLMEQVGLTFRAIKDLDIVLIVEELDSGFGRSFWEFIRAGRYAVAQSSGWSTSQGGNPMQCRGNRLPASGATSVAWARTIFAS